MRASLEPHVQCKLNVYSIKQLEASGRGRAAAAPISQLNGTGVFGSRPRAGPPRGLDQSKVFHIHGKSQAPPGPILPSGGIDLGSSRPAPIQALTCRGLDSASDMHMGHADGAMRRNSHAKKKNRRVPTGPKGPLGPYAAPRPPGPQACAVPACMAQNLASSWPISSPTSDVPHRAFQSNSFSILYTRAITAPRCYVPEILNDHDDMFWKLCVPAMLTTQCCCHDAAHQSSWPTLWLYRCEHRRTCPCCTPSGI